MPHKPRMQRAVSSSEMTDVGAMQCNGFFFFLKRAMQRLRLYIQCCGLVGDLGLVAQIIEGAGMNHDLTIIFSSRSSRKWNTFWVCLP